MNVLVTGANGFIGRALVGRLLSERDVTLSAAVRRDASLVPAGVRRFVVGDLSRNPDLTEALLGIDAVVHLAARVHAVNDPARNPLEEFRSMNVAATANLARQAARRGARRFVFLSSVKVFGDEGSFAETDAPSPVDGYGISKLEAEQELVAIGNETGLEIVIIRPPLVYGSGVKANFASLVRAVRSGVPLPLGAIQNRRSLIALDNLVDFIAVALKSPAAANEIFLVSDGEDISTPELISRLSLALNRPPRLIAVPPGLLRAVATVVGQRDLVRRLLSSLQVDISKARHQLSWTPPISVDAGLLRAVSST